LAIKLISFWKRRKNAVGSIRCRLLEAEKKFPLMKISILFIVFILLAGLHQAAAQGTTAFTYQGQLHDSGTNANGAYTMMFALYDSASGGTQIGSTITTTPILANGLFTVNLDFGAGAFTGAARWLDITITNGGNQTLSPRVQLMPAPYAQFAAIAATVTNGAIKNAQIAANAIATTNIQNGAITTAQIANGAVTNQNLAVNAVATANIQNAAITTAQIANGAVNTAQIANDAVANQNLAPNVISTANIQDSVVTDAKIISLSGSKVSGAVALATLANTVANGSITTASLQDGAVTDVKITEPVASAVTLTNGDWSVGVGTANGISDALIFYNGGIIQAAFGPQTTSGILVSGTALVQGSAKIVGVVTNASDLHVGGEIYGNQGVSVNGDIRTLGNILSSNDVHAINIYGKDVYGNNLVYTSDRNMKEKFTPIDNLDVLERVASLPITTWNFTNTPATRHIGPMAQDFYAAFNVGTDGRHISTVDESGVALAAIQGLNQKLADRLKVKDDKIDTLEKRLTDLEKLVKTLPQTK